MPPTPNRGDSKVGCGRSKQWFGDGWQVSGILQPFCVDAQPSGSIPTSQQQTDGQSCHPKNTKQPKVVESAAFQILHDDATRIWESHCLACIFYNVMFLLPPTLQTTTSQNTVTVDVGDWHSPSSITPMFGNLVENLGLKEGLAEFTEQFNKVRDQGTEM